MKTVLPGQGIRFELDGESLTIDDVVAFSRRIGDASCALSAEAVEKIRATRDLKRELISRETPIYGVTTGFGDRAPPDIRVQDCPSAAEPAPLFGLRNRSNCLA